MSRGCGDKESLTLPERGLSPTRSGLVSLVMLGIGESNLIKANPG